MPDDWRLDDWHPGDWRRDDRGSTLGTSATGAPVTAGQRFLRVFVAFVLVALIAPIVVVVLLSFSSASYLTVPPPALGPFCHFVDAAATLAGVPRRGPGGHKGTAGHLLVIVGFTSSGDVVVNDPAAATASGVRRTYDRAQFEKAWLGGSGGTAYVIHYLTHPLPASAGNW